MQDGTPSNSTEDERTSAYVGGRWLLRVKTTRPRARPGLVERPQLIARLTQGLTRRLALVCAPGGYGKTTVVVQWLAELDRPSGWLSLDTLDNDLNTFVAYLLAAARSAYPDAGTLTTPLLAASQEVPPETFADALIEDFAMLDGALVLALDDFHLIHDSRVLRLMERLLLFVSSNIYFVLISRADPALPLARLRMRGELAELRPDDLRFDPAATAQLLTTLTGTPFDDAAAAMLDKRAEGWVLALQLAGLTMRPGESPAGLAERFGQTVNEHVASYMMQEVFAGQTAPIRDFLLRTSILERLSAPLCQAIGAEPDTAAILDRLMQTNQMIVPLDESRHWFRYHHLFQQFLHDRLLTTVPPATVAELHRRAAAWLGGCGQIDEALSHAVAADDLELAIGLVEDNLHPVLNTEGWQQLARRLALLPATAQTHPSVLVARGWLHLFHLRIHALAQTISAAAAGLARTDLSPARRARLQTQIDILTGVVAYWTFDIGRARDLLERSLPALTPEMTYARGVLGMYFGLATHISGRSAEALRFLQSEIDGQVAAADWMTTRLMMGQMMIYADLGDLQASLRTSKLLERVGLRSKIQNSHAWGLYALGFLCYELDQTAEAEAYLRQVLDSPHQFNAYTVCHAYVMQTMVLQARGREAEADDTLQQGLAFALATDSMMLLPQFAAAEDLLHLKRGRQPASAPAPIPTLDEAIRDLPLPQSISIIQTRVKGLLRTATPESLSEAQACLAVLHEAAGLLNAPRHQAGILALDALAMAALGDEAGALAALRRSLQQMEWGGAVRTYVDCGPALVPLLEQLAAEGFRRPYVERLLAACDGAAASRPSHAASLTRRERDVLSLMAERASNQEIAERLFLTTGSVKTYTGRIFRKLGVSNRREAIGKAAELGLL